MGARRPPRVSVGVAAGVAALAGASGGTAALLRFEPTDPGAVALLVGSLGLLVAGATALMLHYGPGRDADRRRRTPARSLRRGLIAGVGAAVLAALRLMDALTPITAIFVVAALLALEGVAATRR